MRKKPSPRSKQSNSVIRRGKPLETGAKVWTALERSAGLNVKLYDTEVDASIRRSLRLAQTGKLAVQLTKRRIDSTDLIEAFFCAVEPYVAMYSELLALFELMGAQKGQNNLRLEFAFGRPSARPWAFDINTFREQVEQWQRVTRPTRREYWTARELWDLTSLLGESGLFQRNAPEDPHVAAWLRDYEANRWPKLPPKPQLNDGAMAGVLRRLWGLWRSFVTTASHLFAPKEAATTLWEGELAFSDRGVEVANREDPNATANLKIGLASMNHDRWPASTLSGLCSFVARFRKGDPDALAAAEALQTRFADKPLDSRNARSLKKELRDVLGLPIWKHRHELYSVWVFARIYDAIKDFAVLDFAVDNGIFHIPFKAKRLAVTNNTRPTLEIWAELKSPLAKPIGKGRRHNVQPDYTLRAGAQAFMLIECKQYLKPAAGRFAEVIKDYARSTPRGSVILVNYGAAGNSIAPRGISRRATIIGDLRPPSKSLQEAPLMTLGQRARTKSPARSLSEFRESVRRSIQANCPLETASRTGATQQSEWFRVSAAVELVWGEAPRDLDLHVLLPLESGTREIDFQSPGNLVAPPFAELERDVVTGQGPETIRIDKAVPGPHRILVHAYSEDEALVSSGAAVTLTWRGTSERFTCPSKGEGRWWAVADVDFVMGESRLINQVLTQKPDAPRQDN